MELIIAVLMGIFVGLTSATYMCLQPLAERDKVIDEQKEENLQVYSENKELRAELEDVKFDLSVANRKIDQKDAIVEQISYETSRNEYNSDEAIKMKLNKIKELAKDYQNVN